jgi:CIC family chloride channel protein
MISKIHIFVQQPILYLRQRLSDNHFFIVASVLVGLSSGLAAIALKYFVHSIEWAVTYAVSYEEFFGFALFPVLGIILTVAFVRLILKKKLRKGSAEIAYAIIKKSSILPTSDMYAHLITSGLTVGFGGSVGLESPMVNTGAAVGSNFGRTYGLSYKERTVLLGCGAAAGIAAAFNAPIAGVLFAIEVLLTDVTASAFIPLIIAAASGALISKIILKEGIVLAFSLQQPFNYHNIPFYVALGLIAGFVSLFYVRSLQVVELKISSLGNPWTRALMGGFILFILILLFPPLFGEGYETIKSLTGVDAMSLTKNSLLQTFIKSHWHLLIFLAGLIFLKAFAAAITIGSGGTGGSFAPSLFVGAYLGFVFARFVNLTGIGKLPEANFTIVGMAAILSAIFYAPLTAIFLIAELTGGYELMIPLMIVASLSLSVMHFFEPLSLEAKKLSAKLHFTVESRDKIILSRLEISNLIENNFATVQADANLGELVKVVAKSSRNIFPVLNANEQLIGLIFLDKIRQVIFDQEKYQTTSVRDLMIKPAAIVELNENLHDVLQKFESTQQWNLPVLDHDRYVGFLSKSTILAHYRNELLESA